ncbi:phosphatase PAP2 family protein [Paenibacillus sp. MBLB4367]|uniref:phosphatase PAP2 family protein n=1 Tax=Paenibacillus sp. MBLB4367 TaxID=3384767 RepID=UPI0039080AE3
MNPPGTARVRSASRLKASLPLLWLLAIPAVNVFYGILNHGRGGSVGSLMTDLDNQIPFVPLFIIPYLIWYPFIIAMFIVFFLKNRTVYYRSLIALCAGLLVCYLIYALFQTTVPRPELASDGWLNRLVTFVYATDAPYNCFPSIHVLTSYIVMKASYSCRLKPMAQTAVSLTAWSIIVSTLFVKQHAILDLAGAVLLAEALMAVMKLISSERKQQRKEPAAHDL